MELLSKIQDSNASSVVILKPGSKVYNIDLTTRQIQQVDEVVVETDHKSEIVYFKMPRYYDHIDLATTVCVVQYENAKKEKYIYAVPYFDVDTYSSGSPAEGFEEPMICFPWVISNLAAAKNGKITFSFRFYKLNTTNNKYQYCLNTLPSTLDIRQGIGFNPSNLDSEEVNNYLVSAFEQFLEEKAQMAQEGSLTWILI